MEPDNEDSLRCPNCGDPLEDPTGSYCSPECQEQDELESQWEQERDDEWDRRHGGDN